MYTTSRAYSRWLKAELAVRQLRSEIYANCWAPDRYRLPALRRAELDAAAMWVAFRDEVDDELSLHRTAVCEARAWTTDELRD